jgi:ssDNA-binding replication factor A large subunit
VNNAALSARNKRDLHESAIGVLARETDTAIEVVKRLYEQEIRELNSNSTVREFIGVIASRRVKQRLLSARHPS